MRITFFSLFFEVSEDILSPETKYFSELRFETINLDIEKILSKYFLTTLKAFRAGSATVTVTTRLQVTIIFYVQFIDFAHLQNMNWVCQC